MTTTYRYIEDGAFSVSDFGDERGIYDRGDGRAWLTFGGPDAQSLAETAVHALAAADAAGTIAAEYEAQRILARRSLGQCEDHGREGHCLSCDGPEDEDLPVTGCPACDATGAPCIEHSTYSDDRTDAGLSAPSVTGCDACRDGRHGDCTAPAGDCTNTCHTAAAEARALLRRYDAADALPGGRDL
jgi:hypothetical protein